MNDISNKDNPSKPQAQQTEPNSLPAAEIIPPVLDKALREGGLDPGDPNVRHAIEITAMMYRGTLPYLPPPILEAYKKVDPNLPQKILDWTDQQRGHRQYLERLRTEGSEARMNRGQYIAAGIAVSGLVLAAILGMFGNPYVAGLMAVVSVGGPTAAVWLARGWGKSGA